MAREDAKKKSTYLPYCHNRYPNNGSDLPESIGKCYFLGWFWVIQAPKDTFFYNLLNVKQFGQNPIL